MPHEDLRHAPERLVARGVAEIVVHRLEAVEVEEHHRHGVIEAAIAGDLLLEADGEEAAVVEAGDLVLEGELLQSGVGGLELLVGRVQPRGVAVEGSRLLLDGREHAGEGVEQGIGVVDVLARRGRESLR
jgi:hypothetical protein